MLEAHGLAHGRSIPLRPMLEMFRSRFGIGPADDDRTAREKIAGALLLLDPSFADALPLLFDFLGVPDPERPAARLDPELGSGAGPAWPSKSSPLRSPPCAAASSSTRPSSTQWRATPSSTPSRRRWPFEVAAASLFCGELDEAERATVRYESLAPTDPAWVSDFGGFQLNAFMPGVQALLAAVRGHFDEARRLQERAGRAARLSEDARTHVLVGGDLRVQALYRCGDGDAAMAVAAPLLEIAESYGSPHLRATALQEPLGLAHLARGNHPEAARALEEELAIIEEFDASRVFEAQDRAWLAEALLGCGEPERAREAAERALDLATAPGR